MSLCIRWQLLGMLRLWQESVRKRVEGRSRAKSQDSDS